MRKGLLAPLYWGLAFLFLGIFFLLYTFQVLLPYQQEIVWGITAGLALAGIGFLVYMAWHPERWWALIPGFLLLSMAIVVYLGTQEQVNGPLLAAVIFVGLGLAHLFIFLTNRSERWWAWVSAGGFFLLTGAMLWGDHVTAPVLGAFLFLGMGLIFLLLYLILPRTGSRWWALLLAATFVITAAFVFIVSAGPTSLWARVWSAALVLLGVLLIVWSLSRGFRRKEKPRPPTAPPSPTFTEPPVTDAAAISVPDQVPPREPAHSPPLEQGEEREDIGEPTS